MRPRLFSFELAWADAAFDAIFPPPPQSSGAARSAAEQKGTALAHGIATMHPGRFLDDLLAAIPVEQSIGLRLSLWIVALAPLFAIRRLATIASLDEGDRPRVIERLLASPIYAVRQLVSGFKAIGSLLYARSPEIYAQMIKPERTATLFQLTPKKANPSPAHGGSTHEHAAE